MAWGYIAIVDEAMLQTYIGRLHSKYIAYNLWSVIV